MAGRRGAGGGAHPLRPHRRPRDRRCRGSAMRTVRRFGWCWISAATAAATSTGCAGSRASSRARGRAPSACGAIRLIGQEGTIDVGATPPGPLRVLALDEVRRARRADRAGDGEQTAEVLAQQAALLRRHASWRARLIGRYGPYKTRGKDRLVPGSSPSITTGASRSRPSASRCRARHWRKASCR